MVLQTISDTPHQAHSAVDPAVDLSADCSQVPSKTSGFKTCRLGMQLFMGRQPSRVRHDQTVTLLRRVGFHSGAPDSSDSGKFRCSEPLLLQSELERPSWHGLGQENVRPHVASVTTEVGDLAIGHRKRGFLVRVSAFAICRVRRLDVIGLSIASPPDLIDPIR